MAKEKPGAIRRKSLNQPTAAYARRVDGDSGDNVEKRGPTAETEAAEAGANAAREPAAAPDDTAAPPGAETAHETSAAAPAAPSKYAALPPAKAIRPGDPADSAPPPGMAPPGDSRSYRRTVEGKEEFLLVYREHSYLISRRGPVGKLGEWEIIEYPNQGAAAHAYAQKCSALRDEGFIDFCG